MKYTLIICLSLLVCGGLKLNTKATKIPGTLKNYWLKKTRKEMLRDNLFQKAISNSLHFISADFLVNAGSL